jgi:hypothetical protein
LDEIVSNYDPVHLALPWAGTDFFIQINSMHRKIASALTPAGGRGREPASRSAGGCPRNNHLPDESLHDILSLYLDGHQDQTEPIKNLRTAIVALNTAILRFFAAVINIYNGHSGIRTLRALIKPGTISSLLSECQKWASDADVEAELCEQFANHTARAEMRERDKKMNPASRPA